MEKQLDELIDLNRRILATLERIEKRAGALYKLEQFLDVFMGAIGQFLHDWKGRTK